MKNEKVELSDEVEKSGRIKSPLWKKQEEKRKMENSIVGEKKTDMK